MDQTVTVGIPFHKSVNPDKLKLAIDSVLNQSRKPELIHLLQDGEVTPDLSNLIEQYKVIKNIELISFKENQGLAKVLNHSIRMSKTKYYARMDADDVAYPNRLLKQIQFLEDNQEVDILGSYALDIDDNGNELSLRKVPEEHDDIIKYIWTNPMIHPTVVFRLDSIIKAGLYNSETRKRQDYEYWFSCAKNGLKFRNIPEPLLYYRFTEDWFLRNNAKVIWDQVKMGWKGCYQLRLPFYSYIGVSVPLIKILFPKKVGVQLTKVLKKVDPRSK